MDALFSFLEKRDVVDMYDESYCSLCGVAISGSYLRIQVLSFLLVKYSKEKKTG